MSERKTREIEEACGADSDDGLRRALIVFAVVEALVLIPLFVYMFLRR